MNCEILEDDICGDCPSCARSAKLQHENIKLIFPMPVPKKNAEDAYQGIDKKSLDLITQQINQKIWIYITRLEFQWQIEY